MAFLLAACGGTGAASPRPPVAPGATFVSTALAAGDPPAAVVHFSEAGLLPGQVINVTVTADTLASYACALPGSTAYTGAPLPIIGQAAGLGHFHASPSGTLDGTITLVPSMPPGAVCRAGERVRAVRARYSNVAISDLTNQVRAPVDGTLDAGA